MDPSGFQGGIEWNSPTTVQESQATRQAASYNRRRAGRACQVCRARKTKCDNQRPVCGFCIATGGECRYPEDEGTDHSVLDRGSLTILQRLTQMEKSLADLIIAGGSAAGPVDLAPLSNPLGASPSLGSTPNYLQGDSIAENVIQSQSRPDDQPPSSQAILDSAEMNIEHILGWPIFRQDHVQPIVSVITRPSAKTWVQTQELNLDPGQIDQLISNFLLGNHIKNPVLDIERLWAQGKAVAEYGLEWDGDSCLVLLVCAVSLLGPAVAAEAPRGVSKSSEKLGQAEAFFKASQQRIGMVYHQDSVLAMQCSFLTAVYLMSTFQIMAAWRVFTQASTHCVGWLVAHGMTIDRCGHQNYSRANQNESKAIFSDDDKYRVVESLYWSLLKSELELRPELALPGSSLNELPYPHVYPTPPQFGIFHSPSGWTVGGAPGDPGQLEKAWFFYLAEIALRRIMDEAISSRYYPGSWYFSRSWWTGSHHGDYCDYVARLESKLDAWYDTLPLQMRFPREPSQHIGDSLRGILRSHLVDILTVLYFPAIQVMLRESALDVDKHVVDIAQKALQNAFYHITMSKEGFWYRHQGTWLMLRTCSRSSLLLIGAALQAHQRQTYSMKDDDAEDVAWGNHLKLPFGWDQAVESFFESLEYWQDESPDLPPFLERIKKLYRESRIA